MIFFFSGTGNTRWTAQTLASATGEKLLDMADKATPTSHTLADGERIGFCFPVHGWRPPKIVRHFIRRLRIDNAEGHYCYALCTCGDETGKAMDVLSGDLKTIGLHADSVFSIIMPETYVTLPFMLTDTPDNERRKLRAAALHLASISESVVGRESGLADIVEGTMPWTLTHVIGKVFTATLITDSHFSVDSERCLRCGACATACPTGNIDGGKGHVPQWRHDGTCTACLSCYHHCPRHAISYGPLTRRRGQYYFRQSAMDKAVNDKNITHKRK